MINRICYLIVLLITPLAVAWGQQQGRVSGTVMDVSRAPLAGVTVTLKGGANTSITDEEGRFVLAGIPPQSTLMFSYVGMVSQEVRLGDRLIIEVVLEADAYSLEEVVAIGYGVARKKDLTGSIAVVEGEEIAKRNNTQLSQALQGTMPGVMVTRTNSEPGAGATVRVRGVTTIGNSSPLVIVDGVPVNSMDDVNVEDIDDISVLKDAASASIYGARAASGVILITTKRPKTGQLSLEYNANFGFERPSQFPEVVGVTRYLEMINEFTWNDAGNNPEGEYALYPKEEVDNWVANNRTNPNQYPVVNWVDLLVNDYAPRHNHNFSFTAGGEKIKTQASVNYETVDALYDHKTFERVMSRVNNTIDIADYLTAQIDFSFNATTNKAPTASPIWDAQRFAPIYPALWEDGRLAPGQNGSNAYAALHHGGFNDNATNRFLGRVSLQYKPTKDLTFTGVFSPNLYSTKGKEFVKQIPYYAADDPTVFGGYVAGHSATSLYERRRDGKSFTKQLIANYRKDIGSHHFNVMAGYEDFYSFDETLSAQAENYTLSSFPYLDLGPLDYMRNAGSAWETAYQSFFGRLIYDYKNRYSLQANLRYDGSSRFHRNYRWGAFPSVSAGWTISEESFMQGNNALSFLKLRGSWGQLGNERIGNYPYQSSIGYSNALFYRGDNVVSSITAAQFAYAIENITWEITETVNIGVDASFLNNRLMFSGDYYHKNTKDMLLELEIPDYMGFENPDQNTGSMYTKGWDTQLSWRDKIGSVNYSVSVNLSDSRSVMGNLGGIVLDGAQIIRQGTEFNEWYGYVSNGLFQTPGEVGELPVLHGAVRAGDVRYMDMGGPDGSPDGRVTPDYDRVPLGGSLPRYLYGGIINLEYLGIDVSLAFQGVGKQNTRLVPQMVKPFFSAWTNAPAIIDGNYWSHYNTPEENQQARYPRLSYTSGENNNYVMSDYWIVNGAYFRLKNVVLGYTIPPHFVSKLKLNNIRVFASATDLFALHGLPKGWDPEVSYNSYISQTFNFGLSVKF